MSNTINAAVLAASAPVVLAPRKALADALARVVKVTSKRNHIAILGNARLTGDGSSLTIETTDLDVTHRVTIAAPADSRFDVTAPAHMLRDMLKASTSEYVELRAGDRRLSLDFEGPTSALETLPSTDWPEGDMGDVSHAFSVPTADFLAMFDGASAFVSTEEVRYYLNGVFMHTVDVAGAPMLRAVATDGHRLARITCDMPEGAAGMPGVIVPRVTVKLAVAEAKRKGAPDVVRISVSTADDDGLRTISFAFGASVIESKLIDGTFPDYQRVIPTGNDKRATFDRAGMVDAVKRVSMMSSERGRAVRLDFVSMGDGEGLVELLVTNPDAGEARELVTLDSYDGEGLTIGFNASYLGAILDAVPGKVTACLLDYAGAPTVFVDAADDDVQTARFVAVLMPLRI